MFWVYYIDTIYYYSTCILYRSLVIVLVDIMMMTFLFSYIYRLSTLLLMICGLYSLRLKDFIVPDFIVVAKTGFYNSFVMFKKL